MILSEQDLFNNQQNIDKKYKTKEDSKLNKTIVINDKKNLNNLSTTNSNEKKNIGSPTKNVIRHNETSLEQHIIKIKTNEKENSINSTLISNNLQKPEIVNLNPVGIQSKNDGNNTINATLSQTGKNSVKSFETQIYQKISTVDIKDRRKSKILEINANPIQMKFSKDQMIKISNEPIKKLYSIYGDLGQGSYGSVKRVRHKQLGEDRAMKVVKKKSESSHNEIETLKKISHPNIISIYEIFEDSKNYYIMTELLEGGELFEMITTKGSFSEKDAAKITKQILNAVNYLHNQNIVHRDLKPENIMLINKSTVNHNSEIKLIDFGTAKQFERNGKLSKFIGTSYYIAPEVLSECYDEKCDIWSCGVILYILLCGYPPFNGGSNLDIYHSIKYNHPVFTGEEWKDISKEAIDLIKQMLKQNSDQEMLS